MITNYLNGAGPALSIGEVSQEFGDTVLAEGAGQRRILHLLVAENGHGRVAKSANVHRLLEVKLGGALAPHPAPALGYHSVIS